MQKSAILSANNDYKGVLYPCVPGRTVPDPSGEGTETAVFLKKYTF